MSVRAYRWAAPPCGASSWSAPAWKVPDVAHPSTEYAVSECPREGMLIRLDGSHHRWLGNVVPPFALLLAVDDATGCVVNALFCEQDDSHSYFQLIQGLLLRRGIPLARYTDRHPVFKHRSEYQPAGTPTQFGRAMAELGVQVIFALSPQAKGRVEPEPVQSLIRQK